MYEEMSLKKSLAKHGVDNANFFQTIAKDPKLDNDYIRAQFDLADLFAEEIVEIADTDPDAQIARNRIDARKWLASKTKPSKYGDRLDLNVNATVDIGSALIEARKRALPSSDPIDVTHQQLPESTVTIDASRTGCEPVLSKSADDDALPDIFD